MSLPHLFGRATRQRRPVLATVIVLASMLTSALGFAQGNEIKTIPLTVVTTELQNNGQDPGGSQPVVITIPDSSKLTITAPINTSTLQLDLSGGLTNQKLQVIAGKEWGQAIDPNYAFNGKTGAPACGGFVNGQLQDKCPPAPAVFVAEAVGACPSGSFLDAGSGACWACPTGYNRTADPITGTTACSKADASVPLKRMSASFVSKLCPTDSFFDPIRGGECYSCPPGYRRSAAHIDAANACYIPAGEQLSRATRHKKTPWPHECAGGTFHDAWDGGGCWSCPGGYNRTGNHINSDGACSRAIGEQQAHAAPRGQAQCKPGEIQDPRNGGECWTCPAGTYRTVFAVDGKEACEQRAGVRLDKAVQVSPFSCPADSFLDLISSKDANVRTRIEKQIAETGVRVNYGTSNGGTCWSCPPGYDRDLYHVASDAACSTRSMKWQPAPYVQPGLFGLDGSTEVAQALLADKRLIEELIAALAEDTHTPLAQMRKEVYDEIAKAPQSSVILATALYKRIEGAVRVPAQASPAERRLVASLAEAIRQYRIFIAQNALDAYDQWVEARARRLTQDAEKAGFGSLEQMRQNQVAFKGGEVPPDFMEIVSGMIAANVLAPVAMQSLLTTTQLNPQLRHAIWPNRKARAIFAGGREKIGKLVTKTVNKGFSKAAGRLAGQALKMGPQLLVDLAIEMIVATAEHFDAVLNARPKLVTNLAGAKEPVNLLRELNANEGWLHQQWSMSLGAGDKAPANLSVFSALANMALVQAPAEAAMPNPAAANIWRQMPGAGLDIGMGANGTLWVIGTKAVPGGFEIFRWDGRAWINVPGGAVRIDVDPQGYAWIVNDRGEIFRFSGAGWNKLPGLAKDVGVGANGAVWAIGTGQVAGGFEVFRWTGNNWVRMPGGALRIDVDPQGNPWVANDAGDVFRFTGSGWVGVPGVKARDIGIGGDGSVFVTAQDGGILKWVNNAWLKRDGGLSEITVDVRGVPFGVNGANQIWMGYP